MRTAMRCRCGSRWRRHGNRWHRERTWRCELAEKRVSLHCRLGLWRNGRSEPDGATDIAAGGADPSAFFVGADGRAVTGGRLTAEAAEGVVTIRSNRLSEKELRRIFAAFLPEAQPE